MEFLLKEIIKVFKEVIQNSKYENKVFIKGGFLRNFLLEINNFNDVDISIAIQDGEIGFSKQMCDWNKCRSIYNPFIEKNQGTAMFTLFTHPILNNVRFDIKTLYQCSIESDIYALTDFTCNSLYLNITGGNIIDKTGQGLSDIENKILRMVHNDIFQKSPIRVVRLLRLIDELGFVIEPETKKQFLKDYKIVYTADKERVVNELLKIKGKLDDCDLNMILTELKESFL